MVYLCLAVLLTVYGHREHVSRNVIVPEKLVVVLSLCVLRGYALYVITGGLHLLPRDIVNGVYVIHCA